MTHQEIFDKVATHLLTQKKQAVSDEGVCLYRTPSGLSCAVGCLIPDDLYTPAIETGTPGNWHGGEERHAGKHLAVILEAAGFVEGDMQLLRRLQTVHDNNATVTGWRSGLARAAEKFHLSPAILDSLPA